MKSSYRQNRAVLATLPLIAWASSNIPALASDAATEIRALKAQLKKLEPLKDRLKQLEAKVARQDRERKDVASRVVEAGGVAAHPKKTGGSSTPLPYFVDLSQGITVESADHANSFHIGGRIHVDGGGSSQPERGLSEVANIAQARLQVEGKAANIWEYRFQYDFAGNNTSTVGAVGGIRDAYIALKHPSLAFPYGSEPLAIQVGNFWEPMGLERTNSKNFTDFIERSLASDIFGANRHIGVALLGRGSNWSVKTGVFSTSPEDKALSPSANVPISSGISSKAGWATTGGSQYFDVSGRVTYAPIMESERLLHFGASGRYHRPNDSTGANDDRVMVLGASTATESNILKENLLGTPDLSCGAVAIGGNVATAGKCVKDVLGYGAEVVASYGSVSVQAEYMGAHYDRKESSILAAQSAGNYAPGGAALDYSGYYVYGTWYLTGESRADAYQLTNLSPATFRQTKIKNPLSSGGIGAWEVTARFSEASLNNGPYQGSSYANLLALATNVATRSAVANSGVLGGREEDVTFGLNWYPDVGVRLMANYTRVTHLTAPFDRPYLNGAHPSTFLLRTQVNW